MVAKFLVENDNDNDNDSTLYRHHNSNEGFRMNASSSSSLVSTTTDPSMISSSSFPQQQSMGWNRRDRNTIFGPNNEVRTKHDTDVQRQTNVHIGNTASLNSFHKPVAGSYHSKGGQRGTTKGMATFGIDRAGTNSDATKGGALDQHNTHDYLSLVRSILVESNDEMVLWNKVRKPLFIYHAIVGSGISNSNNNSESESSNNNNSSNDNNDGLD